MISANSSLDSLSISFPRKSASLQIGAIGLPQVICRACGWPLHRQLIRRVAWALHQGKMTPRTARCLRPSCSEKGQVDTTLVFAVASIIEAADRFRRMHERCRKLKTSTGRGRPVRIKTCAVCKVSGTSRWFWLHRRCRTIGMRASGSGAEDSKTPVPATCT
jgi:hypothetical protein